MSESNQQLIKPVDSFDVLERKANTLAKAMSIPLALRGKPSDIVAIFMLAQELQIGLIQALNSIHIINGRMAISAQLMLALIRRDVPDAYIKITEGKLSCECIMARGLSTNEMSQMYTAYWDMPRASQMGLTLKDNYVKQPQTMLRWRAVAEAARQVFSDVIMGLYTPDELANNEIVDDQGSIPVAYEDLSVLISNEDLKALSAFMKEKGFTPIQVKNICLEKFRIGSADKLTRIQYRELISILTNTDPGEVKG